MDNDGNGVAILHCSLPLSLPLPLPLSHTSAGDKRNEYQNDAIDRLFQASTHGAEAIDLLRGLLQLNPSKRLSAAQALDHNYFFTGGKLLAPEELPPLTIPSMHEYECKMKRQEEKNRQEM